MLDGAFNNCINVFLLFTNKYIIIIIIMSKFNFTGCSLPLMQPQLGQLPRRTTLGSCSCQFLTSKGLVCRHILRLLDMQQTCMLVQCGTRVGASFILRRPARAEGGATQAAGVS